MKGYDKKVKAWLYFSRMLAKDSLSNDRVRLRG